MASTGQSDRVTNKQLYDELTELRKELPSRKEVQLTVAIGVLGGNMVAAALLKFTSAGDAAHAALGHVLSAIGS